MARQSSDVNAGDDILNSQYNNLRTDVFSRITSGLDADKGAAGDANRYYYATDTKVLYYDDGTSWITLSTWAFEVGDVLRKSADTEQSSSSDTYEKKKEITTYLGGTLRVKFDLKSANAAPTAYGQIYKNGVGYGTERTRDVGTYQTFSEDLTFAVGDKIQLYLHKGGTCTFAMAQNFRIYVLKTDDLVVEQD